MQVAIASQTSHMNAADLLSREHQLWSDAKDLEQHVSNYFSGIPPIRPE